MKSESSLNLSLVQRQVLELLSAALFDREPLEELFLSSLPTDWEGISTLSKEQSILGLVYERILQLPKDLRPPRVQKISMALMLDQIQAHNREHVGKQLKLYRKYEDVGFKPVLLKGITLARLYPHPELRMLGDIDLYLPEAGAYERANEWAKERGAKLSGDSLYEQVYRYSSIVVENHKYVTYFGIPRYDEALSEIMADVQARSAWDFVTIEGVQCRTLPLELNAVYIFHHILHHFSYLGIGFRQICDWILFMSTYGQQMDKALFLDYAQRFDLLRPMQLFALMSVRYLGADASVYPFELPQDEESLALSDLIIADTFEGGNFGFEHFKGKSFSGIWSRRWFMFWRTTKRSMKVAQVSPEHIRLIPLIAIVTRIKLLMRALHSTALASLLSTFRPRHLHE